MTAMGTSLHASQQPHLPLELTYYIVAFLDQPSLAVVARASWFLHLEIERVLYRDVRVLQDKGVEGFQLALDRDPRRARRVRSAHIADFGIAHYALVLGLLKSMPNLESLAILPSATDAFVGEYWDALLEDCEFDFKLLEFVTSLDCDRGLTRFLLRQTRLERYTHSGYTPTHDVDLLRDPLVLPSLQRFVGNVMDLNIIVPHRVVTHVTVQETIATIGLTLFVLAPLRRSKGPVQHLALSLMDPATATTLQTISGSVPSLLSLHLALPPGSRGIFFDAETWGDALPPHLQHLALEVTDSQLQTLPELALHDQSVLVSHWARTRPTLLQVDFLFALPYDADEPLHALRHAWTPGEEGSWSLSSTLASLAHSLW